MKKALLSPLCSAFVIPGLGQIINQHLKKGSCILFAVFILFVAGIVILIRLINAVQKAETINPSHSPYLIDRLRAADYSAFWYLLVAFGLIWLYSVLDAFLTGKKLDQNGKGGHE